MGIEWVGVRDTNHPIIDKTLLLHRHSLCIHPPTRLSNAIHVEKNMDLKITREMNSILYG